MEDHEAKEEEKEKYGKKEEEKEKQDRTQGYNLRVFLSTQQEELKKQNCRLERINRLIRHTGVELQIFRSLNMSPVAPRKQFFGKLGTHNPPATLENTPAVWQVKMCM